MKTLAELQKDYADLSIIGTTHDGEEVEIFRDGNVTF